MKASLREWRQGREITSASTAEDGDNDNANDNTH